MPRQSRQALTERASTLPPPRRRFQRKQARALPFAAQAPPCENAKPGGPQTARLCSVKIIFPLKMRKANAARIQNRPPFCAQRCCGAGSCFPQAGWDTLLGQRQGGGFRLPLYSASTHSRIRSGRLVTMASGCSGSRSRTASSVSTVQKATLMPRSCRRCTMPGCW